ncbi:SufD family Fe-S cluster assembly protein [Frigidibacter sp. MR17.14]|uniref:SufB/SufD family protein n=1 Tax=Frigidibacter sp. MR17.14 TaxID=3126509 RepID=UPI003012E368
MAAPKLKDDRRAEATGARIAAAPAPAGGFTAEARAAALARLTAMGLPGRRDEYWRYTDPAALVATEVAASAPFGEEAGIFDATDRLRVVFTDGVFDAEASDALEGSGLEIARLAEADGAADIHWAKGIYGVLEAAGQSPVERPFAAFGTYAATDGVLIRATAKAARPVAIEYRQTEGAAEVVLHHLVKVEEGAEVTLLETGTAAARFVSVMEVDVAAGGRFHHIRAQGRAHDRRAVTHVFARIAEGALFKSFTLAMNGRLTRNEAVLDIVGDDCLAHVAGAAVGDGADFLHDDTVFITHGAVGCESRQVFKKVLKNGATGVFQGKILVKEGAQKTDGYQISQSLLLDGDSQFLAKPELEIYADDVKCSHGSTSGAIDDTALFYLRSRGVPLADAQVLLVLSFLGDAIAEIEDADLQAAVVERLEGWLIRHR